MAQTNRNIDNMSPFITFCQHVIPLSYDESLSYYETLCALRNYIGQMVEAVNNNADAVTELQNKFTELQNYVDNYFKNLDVQEEINNKLDEMAQDGTLQNIIGAYLELASVLAYNTKSDLKNATNLNNGAFTYTYGTNELLDGYGVFYKIRKMINTDVVDDENILSLTNYPDLIAEKMPNTYLSDLETKINEDITPQIEEINNEINELKKKKYDVIIGDSFTSIYDEGARGGAKSWADEFSKISKNNVINMSDGMAGFVRTGSTWHLNFNDMLTKAITENNLTNENVDRIIIYGGVNDIIHNETDDNIVSGVINLANNIKTNLPNANVYLAYYNTGINRITKENKIKISKVQNAVQKYGWNFNIACGWLFGENYKCYMSDRLHPNQTGCERILSCIINMLNGTDDLVVPVNITSLDLTEPYVYQNLQNIGTLDSRVFYYPMKGQIVGEWQFTCSEADRMSVNTNTNTSYQIYTDIIATGNNFNPQPCYYSTNGKRNIIINANAANSGDNLCLYVQSCNPGELTTMANFFGYINVFIV